MEAPIGSLPNRPLHRNEVHTLKQYAVIDGIYPVYGEQPAGRDTAVGIVVAADGWLYGLVHRGGQWTEIETIELDGTTARGVRVDDMEIIQELQHELGEHAAL